MWELVKIVEELQFSKMLIVRATELFRNCVEDWKEIKAKASDTNFWWSRTATYAEVEEQICQLIWSI
jgi:hypothetical protein